MDPAIIIAAIDGIAELLKLIGLIKTDASQTADWTPEQRAMVSAKWAAIKDSDAWQTDAEKGQ